LSKKRRGTKVGSRTGHLGGLHNKFMVMDRAAVDTITTLLEESLNWQGKAMALIKKLRRKNGKQKNY